MSKKPSSKPGNDNPHTVKIGIAMPDECWLDFKKRQLVIIWTDGREGRYDLSDIRFKEFLEAGCELKNL